MVKGFLTLLQLLVVQTILFGSDTSKVFVNVELIELVNKTNYNSIDYVIVKTKLQITNLSEDTIEFYMNDSDGRSNLKFENGVYSTPTPFDDKEWVSIVRIQPQETVNIGNPTIVIPVNYQSTLLNGKFVLKQKPGFTRTGYEDFEPLQYPSQIGPIRFVTSIHRKFRKLYKKAKKLHFKELYY